MDAPMVDGDAILHYSNELLILWPFGYVVYRNCVNALRRQIWMCSILAKTQTKRMKLDFVKPHSHSRRIATVFFRHIFVSFLLTHSNAIDVLHHQIAFKSKKHPWGGIYATMHQLIFSLVSHPFFFPIFKISSKYIDSSFDILLVLFDFRCKKWKNEGKKTTIFQLSNWL